MKEELREKKKVKLPGTIAIPSFGIFYILFNSQNYQHRIIIKFQYYNCCNLTQFKICVYHCDVIQCYVSIHVQGYIYIYIRKGWVGSKYQWKGWGAKRPPTPVLKNYKSFFRNSIKIICFSKHTGSFRMNVKKYMTVIVLLKVFLLLAIVFPCCTMVNI